MHSELEANLLVLKNQVLASIREMNTKKISTRPEENAKQHELDPPDKRRKNLLSKLLSLFRGGGSTN
jgi:hypothetical protein